MKRPSGSLQDTRRGRRGNVLIEFGLGAGILFSVFAGTFQFGYTFYQYNILKNAVNNGASYASLRTYDSATCTPSDAFKTAVKNMVVYADPTGTNTKPVVPGLTTSNVNFSTVGWSFSPCVGQTGGTPLSVTVSISNYTISAVVGSQSFSNKPSATYPYLGIFEPY
jgi:Flp pilus assembly protein TadG